MEVPGVGALLFVYVEDFQSRTVRQVVGQVHRIAVAKAHTIEHLTIIVAGSRSPDDLVLAVAIDVGNADVVIAILIEGSRAAAAGTRIVRIVRGVEVGVGHRIGRLRRRAMQPAMLQLLSVEVDSPDVSPTVIAATENAAGLLHSPVKMGYSR